MTAARYSRQVRFETPRPLTDYLEHGRSLPGNEMGGLILPPMALAALADATVSRQPCELVVIGEEWLPDGRHYLDFGVSREYIEATSEYRHVKGGPNDPGSLRFICSECREKSGKHLRMCSRG